MIRHYVEQGTHEWHMLRLAKVTGTRLKDALGKDNLSLIDEIIAERISQQYDECYVSGEMQRGNDLEPIARKEYEKRYGVVVEQVGFITSSKYKDLGLSPDGLVGVGGGIEIKCPKTKTHVKYIRQAKVPNEYKCQVLDFFLVNEDLQWHDFISYDPRFTVKPMFVHRTTRTELQTEIETAYADLDKFFIKLEKEYDKVIF